MVTERCSTGAGGFTGSVWLLVWRWAYVLRSIFRTRRPLAFALVNGFTRFPEPEVPAVPTKRLFRRISVAALSGAVAASLAMVAGPMRSQAQSAAALSVTITPEVPSGMSLSNLPTGTGQRVFIQVTNPAGAVALTNQQFVVRFAAKPDVISSVNDGVGSIGLVDQVTGAWYHTIAQLPAGATVTYSVSAFKFCPGRWPIAARVGDKLSVVYASWIGQPDARCGPDETVSPAPASFYALAWPSPSGGFPIVPPASPTSTPSSTTVAPVGVSTTVPGAVAPTTVAGAPRPSLINLTLNASTTTTTTTTTPTTIRRRSGSGPTTTVLFCKTVGGKSYCAPKFSIFKPGQKKIVELKKTTKKRTTKKR